MNNSGTLVKYFEKFSEYKKNDRNVPVNFWMEVAEYWSNIEGSEHIDNDSARKRISRRYRKLEESGFNSRVRNQIHNELYLENEKYLGEEIDVDVDEEGYQEFSTDREFKDEAREKGCLNEYEEFLKSQGIKEEDVSNVYYKQKASGMYFTVQTRPNTNEIEKVDLLDEIKDFIQNNKISSEDEKDFLTQFKVKPTNKICILSAFDAHIDKLAYLDGTDEEADLYSNIAKFDKAIDEISVHIRASEPEYILFPLGSDFWHVNDYKLTTKKGTEMLGRVHPNAKESFRAGLNLLRRTVNKLRSISKVKLMFIKGNHDEDRIKYLLEVMRVAYENQSDVEVIDSTKSRQYERYGNILFGFAHGDKERKADDLPMRMTTDKDSKKHWSEIEYGVFFLGDIHHEKKYKFMESIDFRGISVKFLRSMSTDDNWHWEKGFNGGLKTIYNFVYSDDGSVEQEFKVNIK